MDIHVRKQGHTHNKEIISGIESMVIKSRTDNEGGSSRLTLRSDGPRGVTNTQGTGRL